MRTCAKINLYLRVMGRREDGYHDIQTVFWPLPSLCDEVTVEQKAGSGVEMTCNHPEVPLDERNLCVRAAKAFARATGKDVALKIHLVKRIPVAAGLGGGSSDAASVLLQLRELLAPEMSLADLAQIAVGLGADVPYFLEPVPKLASGVGEKLEKIEAAGAPHLVLVNAGFPIPASWAYAHWREDCPERQKENLPALLDALAAGHWETVEGLVQNDLEHCAFRKFPILCMLRERMEAAGLRHVHVSGSGPTLFGFSSEGTAAEQLHQEFPSMTVMEC